MCVFVCMYKLKQAAIIKYHEPYGLNNRNLFLIALEARSQDQDAGHLFSELQKTKRVFIYYLTIE